MTRDPDDGTPAANGRITLARLSRDGPEAIVHAWPLEHGLVLCITWSEHGEMTASIRLEEEV